jgi:hypothetical protein
VCVYVCVCARTRERMCVHACACVHVIERVLELSGKNHSMQF